jgi:hypothetical protein
MAAAKPLDLTFRLASITPKFMIIGTLFSLLRSRLMFFSDLTDFFEY